MPKDLIKEIGAPRRLEEETSSYRQGMPSWAYPLRSGIESAYGAVRSVLLDPFTSSRKISERFEPRKLPQDMTEEELQQKIGEGPPTLGKAVGAVSDVVTDVASTVPILGDDAIIAKLLSKKGIPVLFGTVPGIKRAIIKGEAGEVTKKGTSIIDKVLNWAKLQYKDRLWTEPTGGFPKKGAQGRFIILKGQAPGTGIKIGNLESEMRFLQKLDPDIDKAHKIYNSNKVLQEYLPEMITRPQLGGNIMFVEQMKPMSWVEIKNLPIEEQRTMFANFEKHLKIIDAEFERLDIHFFDDSTVNWGITREGKPQIMDIGGMAGHWGAPSDTGSRLRGIATNYFDDAAYPPGSKKPLPPKSVGTTKVIPDPGVPTDSFQRKADEILAAAEREAAPAGSTTRGQPLSDLKRRLEMYESLEKSWKQRHPKASPLWIDDVRRMQKEIAAREGREAVDVVKEVGKGAPTSAVERAKMSRAMDKKLDVLDEWQGTVKKLKGSEHRYKHVGDTQLHQIIKKARAYKKNTIVNEATVARHRQLKQDVLDATDELARREGLTMKGGKLDKESVRKMYRSALASGKEKDIVYWKKKLDSMK